MTMRLTIKNEDPMRTARVTYVDAPDHQVGGVMIPPGEQANVWIHSTRKLELEEVQVEPAEPLPQVG